MRLQDKEQGETLRLRAARLLGLGQARKSAFALIRVMSAQNERLALRIESARAVGRLGGTRTVDALAAVLGQEEIEADLQEEVIEALGRTGSSRAIEPLLGHWDDRDGAHREGIRRALRELCRTSGADLLTTGADLLNSSWIHQYPHGTAVNVYLVREDEWTGGYRADWIAPYFDRPTARARRDAALMLALLGTRSDLDRLEHMVYHDSSEENRWLAAIIHQRIKHSQLAGQPHSRV